MELKGGSARRNRREFIAKSVQIGAGIAVLPVLAQCSSRNPATEQGKTHVPTDTGPLFDARYSVDGLANYASLKPDGLKDQVDYGLVPDPVDPGRNVAFLDSSKRLSLGTEWARAAADTPDIVRPRAHGNENDEYWMGVSVFVPLNNVFAKPGSWCTFATGAYGPPWNGPSPLGLAITGRDDGQAYLELGQNYSLLGDSVPFPFNAWLNILLGFRFAYDGWVELRISVGANNHDLRAVSIQGNTRAPYDTLRRGVNDAWVDNPDRNANASTIGVYGSAPMKALFAYHRLAHYRESALPFSG